MYNASNNKSPVCYDLSNSPFYTVRNDFKFYFSSIKHKEKFDREVEERELWLNDSLSRRFKVPIIADILADVQLYTMIEGRGFYIEGSYFKYTNPQQFKLIVRRDNYE